MYFFPIRIRGIANQGASDSRFRAVIYARQFEALIERLAAGHPPLIHKRGTPEPEDRR
jgi:hypothetical protein